MSSNRDINDDSAVHALRRASGKVCKRTRRLRPWLQALIDSEDVHGLCWIDRERGKFRIPWKHGGKTDWSPDSGRIFMEWAKNTGKYREGVDRPQYARWKTRLRCAFNKAPDIVEVVTERQTQDPEPYRVYQFKPVKVVRSCRSRCLTTSSSKSSSLSTVGTASQVRPTEGSSTQVLPTVLAEYEQSVCISDEALPAEILSLIRSATDASNNQQQPASEVFIAEEIEQTMLLLPRLTDSGTPALTLTSPRHVLTSMRLTEDRLSVDVHYRGQTVVSTVTRGAVCHYMFNGGTTDDVRNTTVPDHIQTQLTDSELIELPSFHSDADAVSDGLQDEKIANKLLSSALCHPTYVYADHTGDIFAYRQCRCAVFHASELMTSGRPEKIPLNGDKPTKIFSYLDGFVPALSRYMSRDGGRPDPLVHLLCGQELSLKDMVSNVPLIRVSVASRRAISQLQIADTALARLNSGAEMEIPWVDN